MRRAAATMRRTEAGSDGVKPLALSLVAAIVALSALAASPGRAHPGHRHPDGVAEFGLRFRTSTMQALSIHMVGAACGACHKAFRKPRRRR